MKYLQVCPFCQSENTSSQLQTHVLSVGRKRIKIDNLLVSVCGNCHEKFLTKDQASKNIKLLAEAAKNRPLAITPGFIRNLRESLNINQRDASKMFGAGASSFSKWESGQVPSGPAALLLQTCSAVPEAARYLAKLSGVTIEEQRYSEKFTPRKTYGRNFSHNECRLWRPTNKIVKNKTVDAVSNPNIGSEFDYSYDESTTV